jgi:cytochrome c556
MKRTITLSLAVIASLGAAAAVAQSGNPVEARIALMKDNGRIAFGIVRALRSDGPLDAAAAATAMKAIADNAAKIPALFPAGSNGGNTKALPTVWSNTAEFQADAKALQDAASAAAGAAAQGADTFKAAFQKVGAACDTCHNRFRKEEN